MEDYHLGISTKKMQKICKFFNHGYSKFGNKCRLNHPQNVCSFISCKKECSETHPKPCRYKDHCRRQALCLYLHKSAELANTVLKDEIKILKSNIISLRAKFEAVTMELESKKIIAMKVRIDPDANKNWTMVARKLIAHKSAQRKKMQS